MRRGEKTDIYGGKTCKDEDGARRQSSASQGETPQKKPNRPTPPLCASGLQNCDKIISDVK